MNIGVGLTLPPDCKLHASVAEMFMKFMGLIKDVRFKLYTAEGIYVDLNRNNVANRFMKDNWADILWFVDGDNAIKPKEFFLMLEAITNPEIKILSGIYSTKGLEKFEGLIPFGWHTQEHISAYMFSGIEKNSLPTKLFNMTDRENGKFAVVSAGCLMVKREVFEKTQYPWFLCFTEVLHNPLTVSYIGEDSYFSIHAQMHDFDIWLEPRVQASHCEGKKNYAIGGVKEWHTHKDLTLKERS